MVYPETFDSFMIHDQNRWTDFKKTTFKPKRFGANDVDIKIECCGVCGSDVHKLNGWGACTLPIAVGHEIIGRAVRVGDEVSLVKVGDRVGVGAQVWSCLKCGPCKSDNEQYCPHLVDTYGCKYPKEADPDETISQGGYSSHIRAHEYFVFQIPDEIPSAIAAPMLCAGLTVWSPLSRAKIGPRSKVAVVGLGGLGHFAVIWAAALGAQVSVISHSPAKKADAEKLGATGFITNSHKDWEKPHAFEFDFILNTADRILDTPKYLSMCNINACFHQVGVPDEPLPSLSIGAFMPSGSTMGASHIGSRPEMIAMLKFAAEKKLQPMVETIPISEEGCKKAVTSVYDGKARYRFTLTDFDKVFGPHTNGVY